MTAPGSSSAASRNWASISATRSACARGLRSTTTRLSPQPTIRSSLTTMAPNAWSPRAAARSRMRSASATNARCSGVGVPAAALAPSVAGSAAHPATGIAETSPTPTEYVKNDRRFPDAHRHAPRQMTVCRAALHSVANRTDDSVKVEFRLALRNTIKTTS